MGGTDNGNHFNKAIQVRNSFPGLLTVGLAVNFLPDVVNAVGPVTYSTPGGLGLGLNLDANTGAITGIPILGALNKVVTGTDSLGRTFTFAVNPTISL